MTLPDRALRIGRVVGTVEKHGDVVSITNTGLDLPRSHLRVDGNVRGVGAATDLEFKVSSGAFAFDEMARLIPWVPVRPVQASFSATVRGPVSKLATTIAFRSPAGDAVGDVVVGREGDDPARPLEFRGTLDLAHIDPGVWSNTPAGGGPRHRTRRVHVRPPVGSRGLPARGTFTMTRTDASVAGYEARGAEARGRFDGPRVTLQRARGEAYGGRFDTRGTIGPRDPGQKGVRFDLTGRVDDIDVRRLPPPVPRLRLATDVAGTFHATLDGPQFDATMTFDDSRVEGGRVRAGSIGTFALAPGVIRYGAKARLEALDLGRLGAALDVAWLQDPRVAGPMTGLVDVQAQGRTLGDLSLNAHAVLDRATAAGGVATATTLDARIANRRLDVDIEGDVAHVDPAVATTAASAAGDVSGHVKGQVSIVGLGGAPTAEAFGFDGEVTLGPSRVAGRDITSASMSLLLADGVLGVRRLEAATPLGAVTASGPLALNATAPSDLAYTIRGIPLAAVPRADRRGDGHGRRRRPAAGAARHVADRRHGALCRRRGRRLAQGLEGTSPFSVELPGWDIAQVRLDVHPVLAAGAVGDTVLDTADARVGYGDDRATFDVNASSGDRRVNAAGAADLSTPGERRITLTAAGLSIGEQTWVLDAARQPTVDAAAERGAGPRRALRRRHRPDCRGRRHAGAAGARRVQPARVGPRPRPAADRGAGRAGEPRVRRAAERGRAHHRHRGEAGRAGLVRHLARPLSRAAVRARRRRGPLRRPAPRRRRRRRAGARASRWRSTAACRWRCSRAARRTAADAGPAGGGSAPIDLNIESSSIGLQIVTGLTTAIEQVAGTATVKLRVTGTADNPLFDGGVTLNGGAFTVPATGRRYSDLTTRITFEPGRMKVDDLRVLDEEGDALQASGVLGLRRLAFGDVQMHAQAQRFGFVRNDLARLEVDLDLDVTGQVTRPAIAGTAVIEQGRLEVDRILASMDRNRARSGRTMASPSSAKDRARPAAVGGADAGDRDAGA